MGNMQLIGFALIMTVSSGSLAAEDFMPPRLDFVCLICTASGLSDRTSLERPAIYEGELEIDQATMLEKDGFNAGLYRRAGGNRS